jgi:hypothetical protein
MSFILLYVLFGILVGAVSLYFLKSSPNGWEDSEGFHYGSLDENEIQQTQIIKTKPASELGYTLRQV